MNGCHREEEEIESMKDMMHIEMVVTKYDIHPLQNELITP